METSGDRRSATSAANGAQSRGPASAEGKARSAQNAEKHGLYSRSVVLHREDHDAFAELHAAFHRRFQPANPVEAALVDQLIAATWRIRRLASLESAAIDHAVDSQCAKLDANYESLDLATRHHFAIDTLLNESKTLSTYSRFEASQLRLYDRTLRQLRGLQNEKCKNEPNSGEVSEHAL